MLLLAGADVEALRESRPPLACAIEASRAVGGVACMRLLLSAKAELCYPRIAAVHFAAQEDSAVALRVLSAAKADLNQRMTPAPGNVLGGTPAYVAANYGCLEALRFLADMKADLDATCATSPLHAACLSGQTAAVRILVRARADVNARDRKGATAIFAVAAQGCTECLQLLLEAKACAGTCAVGGDTAMHVAIKWFNCVFLRPLAAAKADVNAADRDGRAPLHWAAGRPDMIHVLGNLKADLDQRDAHGATPLLLATDKVSERGVQALLALGADPNVADASGNVSLAEAASNGRLDMTCMLLSAKADPTVRVKMHGRHIGLAKLSVCGDNDKILCLIEAAARGDWRSVNTFIAERSLRGRSR